MNTGEPWPRWYAVQVQVAHETKDGWSGSRSLPTFYLDSHVQGITSEEHAVRIARDIVSGDGLFVSDAVTFHVTAVAAEPSAVTPGEQQRKEPDGSEA